VSREVQQNTYSTCYQQQHVAIVVLGVLSICYWCLLYSLFILGCLLFFSPLLGLNIESVQARLEVALAGRQVLDLQIKRFDLQL